MASTEMDYMNAGNWLNTQQLIAPVFLSLVATTPLKKNELFIYDNQLYKVTADIAQNDPIVVGTNAKLANTINDEIFVEDISEWIYSNNFNSIYYAYRIGKVVHFAVYTNNVTIAANDGVNILLLRGTAPTRLYPVLSSGGGSTYTALSTSPGSSSYPHTQAVINHTSMIILRTTTAVTNGSYWISGSYICREE